LIDRDSGMAAGPGRHRQRAREWLGRYISGRAGWAGGLILAGGVLRLPATLGLQPAVCTRVSILMRARCLRKVGPLLQREDEALRPLAAVAAV
jgi:hypothetical protein